MMQTKIDSQIVFLGTRKLGETGEFYERNLGLRLAVDQGMCRIYEVTRGAFLGFCARDRVSAGNDVIISFVTDDVDGLCERLKLSGVKIEQEPAYHSEFKIYHCFFRDPNGYRLEAQRFDDPVWMHGKG